MPREGITLHAQCRTVPRETWVGFVARRRRRCPTVPSDRPHTDDVFEAAMRTRPLVVGEGQGVMSPGGCFRSTQREGARTRGSTGAEGTPVRRERGCGQERCTSTAVQRRAPTASRSEVAAREVHAETEKHADDRRDSGVTETPPARHRTSGTPGERAPFPRDHLGATAQRLRRCEPAHESAPTTADAPVCASHDPDGGSNPASTPHPAVRRAPRSRPAVAARSLHRSSRTRCSTWNTITSFARAKVSMRDGASEPRGFARA